MIDVAEILRSVPNFKTFCSVSKLQSLVETLRTGSPSFKVQVAGTSVNGVPIHHLRFGTGAVKVLVVAGPHCKEPIGSLTVFSLMTLLHQGNRALLAADVEWHIVPCVDPDGALLNEGWTQKPFTLEDCMRNYYEQPSQGQVDRSFPIKYKNLVFDKPTQEALILRGLLEQIRPDFFYTLHDSGPYGGTWFAISHDIDQKYYRELYGLLEQQRIPLRVRSPASGEVVQFGKGISEMPTVRRSYDHLEKRVPSPQVSLQGVGAGSSDYLMQIKSSALTFCTELSYLKHRSDMSANDTGHNLRQLKLRIDADNKFLASVILEEWDQVKEDLDPTSPFHRKIHQQLVAVKDKLHEGVFDWNYMRIHDLLFNPADSRTATEGDRFGVWMGGRFRFLYNGYSFVRLLKVSKQTPAVRQATERMERMFDEALAELSTQIDSSAFEVIDCGTLARVQLGSGLIALNSVLEARHNPAGVA